jgi:hypothetical protein
MVKWLGVRPAHQGTQVTKYATVTGATGNVHTVTAGKTFFMTSLVFSAWASVAGSYARVSVRNESDVLQYTICYFYMRDVSERVVSVTFPQPVEIAAGWDVFVVAGDANTSAFAFVHGWEE